MHDDRNNKIAEKRFLVPAAIFMAIVFTCLPDYVFTVSKIQSSAEGSIQQYLFLILLPFLVFTAILLIFFRKSLSRLSEKGSVFYFLILIISAFSIFYSGGLHYGPLASFLKKLSVVIFAFAAVEFACFDKSKYALRFWKTLRRPKTLLYLAYLLFLIAAALVLMEVSLRVIDRKPLRYYVQYPNLEIHLHPDESIVGGIHGESVFSTNRYGIRGDLFSDDDQYRILAIGGSTTECFYLDDSESWPMLLQGSIRSWSGRKVHVGNIGKSGLRSICSIGQILYYIPQLPKIDAVVALVGVNDLAGFISFGFADDIPADAGFESPIFLNKAGFALTPAETQRSFIQSSRFIRRIEKYRMMRGYQGRIRDTEGKKYENWRMSRRSAKEIVNKAPEMDWELERYGKRLEWMVAAARKLDLRIIFATQPTLWKPQMPESEQALLWYGGIGNFFKGKVTRYYSTEVLAEVMDRYNEKTRVVSRELGVELVDLARIILKNTDSFYDDCHFNENGAGLVTAAMSKHFEKNGLQ